jgi:hypothetical protein
MKKALVTLALLALGCSTTMTAEQHRQAAQVDQLQAKADEAKFDPTARAQGYTGHGPAMAGKGPFDTEPGMVLPGLRTYNPTEKYLDDAKGHRDDAAQHLAQAKELEAFEDAECIGVSQEARAACPLITPKIAKVEEIAQGVRLHLREGVDANALSKTMGCHLAFARAHGYDSAACPLYLPGVALRAGEGVIELRTQSPKIAADLRAEARAFFAGPPAVSATVAP